jgi:ATP-dependent Clp protease ATP-binding subunit ClpA
MTMVAAQQEARALSHTYVGTEHFVLAVLNPDGLGVRAIGQALEFRDAKGRNHSYSQVRREVAAMESHMRDAMSKPGTTSYTERAGLLIMEPRGAQEPFNDELMQTMLAAGKRKSGAEPADILGEILKNPRTAGGQLVVSLGKIR